MNKKNLIIRSSFIFLMAVISTAIFLDYLKSKEIQTALNKQSNEIKNAYLNRYSQLEKQAELIFFNNLLYDKELLNLYSNISVDNTIVKKRIFDKLKDRFYYFKSFDVKEINFYLPNSELFLSMSDYKKSSSKTKEIIKYANEKLRDTHSLDFNKNSSNLNFVKLLFNEKLNHLGVVEITFSKQAFNELSKKSFPIDIKEEESINSFYNVLFVISFFVYMLIFYLYYKSKLNRFNETIISQKYSDLTDALDKYIVMVETDKKGFITNVTQSFCNISGYSKDELIGENINIIRHPNMSDKFFQNMWEQLSKGKAWEGEIVNQDKFGNSYWVKGTIFPKYDEEKNVIGFISIRVDITDAKQLKKINKLLKEDLSNKLNEIKVRDKSIVDNTKVELMGKILDSLSYQWKNPVSNISIQLANLKARLQTNDLNTNKLESIHDEIETNLKTLSITLNDFSSMFTKRDISDRYNVFLAVKESISLVKQECKLHNISLKLESKKDIFCYGVYNELKYIVFNLLKHSITHIVENSIDNGSIELSIVEDDESVLLRFKDNVNCESKNIIEKVFKEQNDEFINKDEGINLTITKLLIQKIGATIWFENKKEETIFYIKLVSKDRRTQKRQ